MIDHIFMLVDPGGPEIAQMTELGLLETYRRVHTGQGTRNICYCFDNMFLELLWVDDPKLRVVRLSKERDFTNGHHGEVRRFARLELHGELRLPERSQRY